MNTRLLFALFLFIAQSFCSDSFELNNLPIGKTQDSRVVCRNEVTGEELDWFTLYKLPKLQDKRRFFKLNSRNSFLKNGTAYMFMTNKQPEWKLSSLSLNDSQSLPAKTLELLYSLENNTDFGYVLYSDQADQITFEKGHAKGVLLFNEKSAVWLVHSIPHYPPKPSQQQHFIRPSQCVFGQSMLCMSFSIDQLELIAQQLLYSYPQVYDYFVPALLQKSARLEPLIRVLNGEHVTQAPWSSVKYLKTAGGEQMLSFAKYTNFEDDLYAALVAPTLQSNIFTETWNNGVGTMPSNCSSSLAFNVYNIQQINLDFLNLKFSVHQDHSKWVVTNADDYQPHYGFSKNPYWIKDEEARVACVGDINRQYDQLKRGGGTVCFMRNRQVWHQYYRIVSQVEECREKFSLARKNRMKARKFKSKSTNESIILLG